MSDEYAETERPALDTLRRLGWDIVDRQQTMWDDPRETTSSVVLEPRLCDAVERLNPWISENNLNKAVREIQQVAGTNTMDENRKIHEKLVRHTSVEQDRGHGLKHQTVRYIDYENPANNDFFALIPCCTFKINSPDDAVQPESGPAVMSRTQMLRTI